MGHKQLSGDYQVDNATAVLGRGRFSTVKSVFSRRHQRRVAAKIIPLAEPESEDSVDAALREYHVLSKLNHDNVVDVYDYLVGEGAVWITMELAKGGDLRKFVHARRRLSEKVARQFLAQILAGVAYIHGLGVVHRDVKCENILVTEDGDTVKLCDFGSAAAGAITAESGQGSANAAAERHHLGSVSSRDRVYGSPAYAAPEVLGRAVDHRDPRAADVWSTGVVLFFMVTGYLPFGCDQIGKILVRMRAPLRWPRPLRQLERGCRDYAQDLLRLSPDDRPTAAAALQGSWLLDK